MAANFAHLEEVLPVLRVHPWYKTVPASLEVKCYILLFLEAA